MPNRCTLCKQAGHNRTTCPHDAATATSLREAFNQRHIESVRRMHQDFNAMLARQNELKKPPPTVRELKIQEILFENATELSDGLYKQLMDALVIQD